MSLSVATRSVDVATLSVVRINNLASFKQRNHRANPAPAYRSGIYQALADFSNIKPWQTAEQWDKPNTSKYSKSLYVFHYKILSLVQKLYHGNEI